MIQYWCVFTLLGILGSSSSLFVPDQVPTLLSFLYSNIPPIKKGTDSRIGLGFRLGPNADFQVMFELGPQENTQAIGPDAEGNSKREAWEYNTISPIPSYPIEEMEEEPTTWLQAWKHKYSGVIQPDYVPEYPMLDQDVIDHLSQLYKDKT